MQKKSLKCLFADFLIKKEFNLINILSPTVVPNLVTLAWKVSPGMSKEAGSLNGTLCTYLMRQNLHDQIRLRS